MRRIDYHTHTCFSPDAISQPEEHILEAIHKGLMKFALLIIMILLKVANGN